MATDVVTPHNEAEAMAVARALGAHRDHAEDVEALKALTPFERLLAQRAYDAGRNAVTASIQQAIGGAAVTLDARQVAAAIRGNGADFDWDFDFNRDEGWCPPRYDPQAARIVGGARRSFARQCEREDRFRQQQEGMP